MKKSELLEILKQIGELAAGAASDSGEATSTNTGAKAVMQGCAQNTADQASRLSEPQLHKYGKSVICETDGRGFATPGNRSPLEIRVDASEGFIPLWHRGVVLRWKFNATSLNNFQDPNTVRSRVRRLLAEAMDAWGDSAPIRLKETEDAWDFEIVVNNTDSCSINGCTLARAFFPDSGRHDLAVYPQMFEQSEKEQVDTMIHELGHVFGLRHFFADVSEAAWPSEVFGTNSKFTIMNYGAHSELTAADKADLKRLYQEVWSGHLTEINGTPIRLFYPFHAAGTTHWR